MPAAMASSRKSKDAGNPRIDVRIGSQKKGPTERLTDFSSPATNEGATACRCCISDVAVKLSPAIAGRDISAASEISAKSAKSAARNRSISRGRVSTSTRLITRAAKKDAIERRINQRVGGAPVAYHSQRAAKVDSSDRTAKNLSRREVVMDGMCSSTEPLLWPFAAKVKSYVFQANVVLKPPLRIVRAA